jgi:hypothetical protein
MILNFHLRATPLLYLFHTIASGPSSLRTPTYHIIIRHTHPRLPIPQRRHIRHIHPPLLAPNLHLPPRSLPRRSHEGPPRLHPRHPLHPLPRHHNSSLLCNAPRRLHEPARVPLPRSRPTRLHRPLQPGFPSPPRLLPRYLRAVGSRRHAQDDRILSFHRPRGEDRPADYHTQIRTILYQRSPLRARQNGQRRPNYTNPNPHLRKHL